MEKQLNSNLTPAERLDIFIALKEADALDTLRSYTSDLDFSNFPLDSSIFHTLCLVLSQRREVNSLSLANCGIDDDLLMVFASNMKGFQLKVSSHVVTNFQVSSK